MPRSARASILDRADVRAQRLDLAIQRGVAGRELARFGASLLELLLQLLGARIRRSS